jgi:RHS repeat-associated protein
MELRSISRSGRTMVYVDGLLVIGPLSEGKCDGTPGIALADSTTLNGFYTVRIRLTDWTPPSQIPATGFLVQARQGGVDLSWLAASDGADGGVARYVISRDGAYLGEARVPAFADTAVTAGSTYTYSIQAVDYFLNFGTARSVTVTIPQTGADRMRRGVRPQFAHWGALGENISMMSGNLNYAVPLITAQGRGGWSLPLGLSYNSQNWRKDAASSWSDSSDIGYGFGWTLTPGSIRPVYSGINTVHHYRYTDSTGAQYMLNLSESGWWRTTEGPLFRFDAATSRLWFPDGSFWYMGAESGGAEPDAGSLYPTQLHDSNGNYVLITYKQGNGAPGGSTSGRIATISDIRAATEAATVYLFEYNTDSTPHLIRITNQLTPAEKFEFTYLTGQPLVSPFSPYASFGTTALLSTITHVGLSETFTFTYGANNAGELTSVVTGQHTTLRWVYSDAAYATLTWREVTGRYYSNFTGDAEWYYAISSSSSSTPEAAPETRTVVDPSNNSGHDRMWTFNQSTTSFAFGLPTRVVERNRATGTTLVARDMTYAQDARSNLYLSAVTTTLDPGSASEKVAKMEMDVDGYGNVTAERQYDYGNLTTPARTSWRTMNTALRAVNIWNRPATTGVTAGSTTLTLATYIYDDNEWPNSNWAAYRCGAATLTDRSSVTMHDPSYGASYRTRGLPRYVDELGKDWACSWFDITGNVVSSSNSRGSVAYSYSDSTRYAVPMSMVPNGNSAMGSSMQWDSVLNLTSATGPNSATTAWGYDSLNRNTSTTDADNVTSAQGYGTNYHGVAVGNNGTSYHTDGAGRTRSEVHWGNNNQTAWIATTYGPCACSPIGKMAAVSMPYAPYTTPVFTNYAYDARGRTLSITPPGGAGSTTYVYAGNTVTVTDPSGRWKKFTMDALGRLTQVTEPGPNGGANVETYYTYNLMDKLTSVTMTRNGTTQTRTFTYDANMYPASVTMPETGTTTYEYRRWGQLYRKTDARGRQVTYGMDVYGRPVYKWYSQTGSTDTSVATSWTYDVNENGMSRLASVTNSGVTESYTYTLAGRIKTKAVSAMDIDYPLKATFLYNSAGRLVQTRYPDLYNADGTVALAGRVVQNGTVIPGYTTSAEVREGTSLLATATYNPAGQPLTFSTRNSGGTYDTANYTYNSRGQLTQQTGRGANIEYRYSATANDGRLTSRKDNISGEEISYQYDELGRLIAAATTDASWGLSWTYDGFGNRLARNVTKGTAPTVSLTVDPATNRISTSGFTYNVVGDLTAWPVGNTTATANYNRAHQMVTSSTAAGSEWYFYSVSGQRVALARTGAVSRFHFYGLHGELLGVYALETRSTGVHYISRAIATRVWLGGLLVSSGDASITRDQLGSVVQSGTETLSYYPYGEQRTGSTTTNDREKFATYLRDENTRLDYAQNRYYSSTWGRFTTADPYTMSGGLGNPQGWNRYAYVENDPVNWMDPNGLRRRTSAVTIIYHDDGEGGGSSEAVTVDMFEEDEGITEYAETGGGRLGIGSKQEAKDELNDAVQSLADDCFKKLGTTRSAVQAKAANIKLFDGRLSVDGAGNISQLLGPGFDVSRSATFNSISSGYGARVLTYVGGTISNTVVLGPGFFDSDKSIAEQWLTLAHEVLHSALNKNDLAFAGVTGYTGKSVLGASEAFNQWLKNKCK